MIGKNRVVLLALLFALFVSSAFATQISVSVSPKNKAIDVLRLYSDETAELEIVVTNNSAQPVENLNLRFSVKDTSLSLLKDSLAVDTIAESIPILSPGEIKLIFVKVKPKEFSQEQQPFSVNYGFETFTHGAFTIVEIAESPLEIQGRLAKSALDSGEGSKLVLQLKNKGDFPIRNISAEIIVPNGLITKSPPLTIGILSPGESIMDKEFIFDVDPIVSGRNKIVLLASFEDAAGKHVLERDYFVDVQNRSAVIYFLVAAIIVLIVIALYIKRKPSRDEKPLGEPELKELNVEGGIKTMDLHGNDVKK
ncbi:MAG: hypothetical protein QGI60_00245 [archaeon]|jgi:uncharacterized membrane protein|nr:hypothetical protein [archaeon]